MINTNSIKVLLITPMRIDNDIQRLRTLPQSFRIPFREYK